MSFELVAMTPAPCGLGATTIGCWLMLLLLTRSLSRLSMYGGAEASGWAGGASEDVLMLRSSDGGLVSRTDNAAELRTSALRRLSKMSSESLCGDAKSFAIISLTLTSMRSSAGFGLCRSNSSTSCFSWVTEVLMTDIVPFDVRGQGRRSISDG